MIRTEHSTVALLPNGNHPSYRPYSAVEGKPGVYRPAVRKFPCACCPLHFDTDRERHQHFMATHKGRA